MRVLSVRQPWASLIGSGKKTIELRSWRTAYRGPVLVVSGAQPWKGKHDWPLGPTACAICVVDLVDCRAASVDDAAAACIEPPADHYAWVLRNQRPVTAVPVKGRLGLYRADEELMRVAGAL